MIIIRKTTNGETETNNNILLDIEKKQDKCLDLLISEVNKFTILKASDEKEALANNVAILTQVYNKLEDSFNKSVKKSLENMKTEIARSTAIYAIRNARYELNQSYMLTMSKFLTHLSMDRIEEDEYYSIAINNKRKIDAIKNNSKNKSISLKLQTYLMYDEPEIWDDLNRNYNLKILVI